MNGLPLRHVCVLFVQVVIPFPETFGFFMRRTVEKESHTSVFKSATAYGHHQNVHEFVLTYDRSLCAPHLVLHLRHCRSHFQALFPLWVSRLLNQYPRLMALYTCLSGVLVAHWLTLMVKLRGLFSGMLTLQWWRMWEKLSSISPLDGYQFYKSKKKKKNIREVQSFCGRT